MVVKQLPVVYRLPRRADSRRSCAKYPRHVVGLAGMVVDRIVDGYRTLAAIIGGLSLKIYASWRWQRRDYLRRSSGEDRRPIVRPCGNGR
jgi:hypothetical protein